VNTAWHITADFLAPLVLGVRFAHPRDVFPALAASAATTWPRRPSRWRRGTCTPGKREAPCCRPRRHEDARGGRVSIGIQDSLAELGIAWAPSWADGYQRGQDQGEAGWTRGRRGRAGALGAVQLMVECQRGLPPGRIGSPGRVRAASADDDRVAPRRRRHPRLTPPCSAHRDRRVPRRVRFTRCGGGTTRSDAGACRIINIKPGRLGGHGESIRLHESLRQPRRARSARRHARSGIGRATTCTCPRSRISRCPAMSRRAALL